MNTNVRSTCAFILGIADLHIHNTMSMLGSITIVIELQITANIL